MSPNAVKNVPLVLRGARNFCSYSAINGSVEIVKGGGVGVGGFCRALLDGGTVVVCRELNAPSKIKIMQMIGHRWRLVVVFFAMNNCKGAVNLFQQNRANHFVRESHGRK